MLGTLGRSISAKVVAMLGAAALALLVFGTVASGARADVSLCGLGSGAAQCISPEGVAADYETERIFVADRANNRVDIFEENGTFVKAFGWGVDTGSAEFQSCTAASGCQAGIAGEGSGQFSSPRSIAVDNDPASSSFHDVYVVDYNNSRVEKFSPAGEFLLTFGGGVNKTTSGNLCTKASGNTCGSGASGTGLGQLSAPPGFGTKLLVGTGPNGTVYVVDNSGDEPAFTCRLKQWDAGGNFVSQIALSEGANRLCEALAVESGGNFFVYFERGNFGLKKFDTSGNMLETRYTDISTGALAVDEADGLYAIQTLGRVALTKYSIITRFNPAGAIVRRWGYGLFDIEHEVPGLAAPNGTSGGVLVSETGEGVRSLDEPQPGPLAAPTLEAKPGSTKATLRAEVNPEGKATSYRFEYVDDAAFQATGFATAKSTPEISLGGAADFNLHLAEAQVGCNDPVNEASEGKCLVPGTVYHFRVVASNADNTEGLGPARAEGTLFETGPPVEIKAVYATEIGGDTARLKARVNPLGLPTGGYFEYVDQASFEASGFANATKVPAVDKGAGEIDFGAGEVPVTRSVTLTLTPGTTYHYRAVITDPLIPPLVDKEHILRTFALSAAEVCAENEAFRGGASALLPDCRAYELVSPLDKENGDIIAPEELATSVRATLNQAATAGSRVVYGSYRAFGDANAAPYAAQYLAARGKDGWSSHTILAERDRSLLEVAESTFTELKWLSPDLCEGWDKTFAEPVLAPGGLVGFPNIYRRLDDECGGPKYEPVTTVAPAHGNRNAMGLRGVADGGVAAIYSWADNLPGTEAPDLGGAGQALYYQRPEAGAEAHYVCILPSGAPLSKACAAGTGNGDFAASRRDSVWHAISASGDRVFWSDKAEGPGKLYVRINPDQPQSEIVAGQCTEPGKACTLAVSAKGEELSGTTSSRYWGASANGSLAIFTTGNDLYTFDVNTKTTTPVAHKSAGIMGASEDASRIYLASEEVLTGEPNGEGHSPTAGKPNLYLYQGSNFHFIATLVASTDIDPGRFAAINIQPNKRTSRVSPSGLFASFMTSGQPTGFDNTDAASGPNCGETGGVCDAEVFRYDAAANGGKGQLNCVSCNPTGARPVGTDTIGLGGLVFHAAAFTPAWESTFYGTRALSDDGSRLYFNAADRLAPQDSNGVLDVYQWEAAGVGGCSTQSPDYSAQNEGCVRLISSGQSSAPSEFTDASADGNDAFFTTLASLAGGDYGLIDIYDARVGGGFPEPPPSQPGCEGETCQNPAPSPGYTAPPTLSLEGPENLEEKPAKPRKCPKGKVKKKGKCVKKKKAHGAKRRAGR